MISDNKLVKFYEGLPAKELCSAPIDALQGASAGDAEKMKAAFGIDNIREMANLKYFVRAKAIAELAQKEEQQQ